VEMSTNVWDLAVIGAGPAGLVAARAAAAAGARTVVIERLKHPRYKTCGGGLVGRSVAEVVNSISVPVREQISTACFTLNGRRTLTRKAEHPFLQMVMRDEFDDALRLAAIEAGAEVWEQLPVRAVWQDADFAYARLIDGTDVRSYVMIGADGSSGVSSRHVDVNYAQVDLGLELEIPVPELTMGQWRGRILIDWGPIPGSYGWVFPKSASLTVGVIAARGQGEGTREYLQSFLRRLGLASIKPTRDSGHLTRCRSDDSPLRKGRVLVAGDAAGLLDPWTREGISFALRSGSAAGAQAGRACAAGQRRGEEFEATLEQYVSSMEQTLVPEMKAGRLILRAFARHPGVVHAALATSPGWREFVKFCSGDLSFSTTVERPIIGSAVSLLARV
jgi:geranylgeranyl reductase family protein